jgi:hypothetical protein
MPDIDDLTQAKPIKDYRKFTLKAKIRLTIFVML